MEEILLALLELFLEALVWFPVDFGGSRRFGQVRQVVRTPGHLAWSSLPFLIAGAVLGGLSLLVFPTALVRSVPLRATHCMLSPFLAGWLARALARRGARLNPVRPRLGFWRAFFLTAGFAVVRFGFAN